MTTITRKILGLAGLTAIAVLASAPTAVSAHTVRFTSQLSASYSWDEATGDFISGQVSAERPRLCEIGRTFRLYERDGDSSLLVESQTNPEGPEFHFFPKGAQTGDTYYVSVIRTAVKMTTAHKHVCEAARSNNVRVGPR